MAAPRNAFLALVGINVRGLATTLLKTLKDPVRKEKLRVIWVKLGGAFSKLEGTITKGAKKRRILGVELEGSTISGYIGVEPVTISTAAILAAAVPIIAALAQFLKVAKSGSGATAEEFELDSMTDEALKAMQDEVEQTGTPAGAPGSTFIPGVPNVVVYAGAGLGVYLLARNAK